MMNYRQVLSVIKSFCDINSTIYHDIVNASGQDNRLDIATYHTILHDGILKGASHHTRIILKGILDANLRLLGFNERVFLDHREQELDLTSSVLKAVIFLQNIKRKDTTKVIASKSNNNVLGTLRHGLYVTIGLPFAGKQLINNFIMHSFRNYKISMISCGERSDVLFREKRDEIKLVSKLLEDNLSEDKIYPSFSELINMIIGSSSDVIIINSINQVLNENSSGSATKGGIDKNAIEKILTTINIIAETLGKIIICTYRTTSNEIENGIMNIIDGISWGFLYIEDGVLTIHNRFNTNKDTIVHKSNIISINTSIVKEE